MLLGIQHAVDAMVRACLEGSSAMYLAPGTGPNGASENIHLPQLPSFTPFLQPLTSALSLRPIPIGPTPSGPLREANRSAITRPIVEPLAELRRVVEAIDTPPPVALMALPYPIDEAAPHVPCGQSIGAKCSNGNFPQCRQSTVRDERVESICCACGQHINSQYIFQVSIGFPHFHISNRFYHEECSKCAVCSATLNEMCYVRDCQLLCREHYYSTQQCQCAGCLLPISPSDMVYKLKAGIVYHVHCHRCCQCQRLLAPGEQILVDENTKLVACISHYAGGVEGMLTKEMGPVVDEGDCKQVSMSTNKAPHSDVTEFISQLSCTQTLTAISEATNTENQARLTIPSITTLTSADLSMEFSKSQNPSLVGSAQNGVDEGQPNETDRSSSAIDATATLGMVFPQYPCEMYVYGELYTSAQEEGKLGGSAKRRGPRTTIKQEQLDVLNRVFGHSPKPTKHMRAKLALEAGLSMRVIQVWFQNRRSKERRLKHLCNFLRHYEQSSGNGQIGRDSDDSLMVVQVNNGSMVDEGENEKELEVQRFSPSGPL